MPRLGARGVRADLVPAALEVVLAGPAVEPVPAGPARQYVAAEIAVDVVVAVVPVDRVAPDVAVQVVEAGMGSVFPAASIALTWKVWEPSERLS